MIVADGQCFCCQQQDSSGGCTAGSVPGDAEKAARTISSYSNGKMEKTDEALVAAKAVGTHLPTLET